MEIIHKIIGYITFRKKDADAPDSTNLKIMHGINRISIYMFLLCLILIALKYLR